MPSTYEIGVEWDIRTPEPEGPFADEAEEVEEWWPGFCHGQNFQIPTDDKNVVRLPPLLDWYRERDLEVFEVGLRGRMGEVFSEKMGLALRTARGARQLAASIVDDDPGHVRFILNHFQLPAVLPFDPGKVPAGDNLFYLGELVSGPDAVWNPDLDPHVLLAGTNGSGKTETASMLLCQAHRKGAEIIIISPTGGDVNFVMFEQVGHTVLADAPHVDQLKKVVAELERVLDLFPVRQARNAEAGRVTSDEPFVFIVIDEFGRFMIDKHGDTDGNKLRARIREAVETIAKEGRKLRVNLMLLTQQPYVDEFGANGNGGGIMMNLRLRVAVKSLDKYFQGRMFTPPTQIETETIAAVLSGSTTPPGRGIAVGLQAPTDPLLAGFPVNGQPVQIAHMGTTERADYIGAPSTGSSSGVLLEPEIVTPGNTGPTVEESFTGQPVEEGPQADVATGDPAPAAPVAPAGGVQAGPWVAAGFVAAAVTVAAAVLGHVHWVFAAAAVAGCGLIGWAVNTPTKPATPAGTPPAGTVNPARYVTFAGLILCAAIAAAFTVGIVGLP